MVPRQSRWLLFSFALAAAGCSNSLEDRPCPCGEGWSCSPVSHRCVEGPATQVVDDMHQPSADGPGTGGAWYTYSDRTVPNSLPIQYRRDAGFVSPSEAAMNFDTSTDGDGPVVNGAVQPYRRVDAGGETLWGVGFGMDFSVAPSDGEFIPFNDCNAGQVWSGGKVPRAFDASGWTGIQFWARSFGAGDVRVEIHVDDDRTSPWGQVPLDAGGCNACYSAGADASACSDSFSNGNAEKKSPVVFPAAGWKLFQVPFASLHSGNWAEILDASAPIHSDKIYNLHFQVSTTNGASVPPFSVGVAYVTLYKS